MNTEYVIIPVCIPMNDTDYLKVSDIPFSIWHRDDETGRLIDPMQSEQEAINKAAQIYKWAEGKLDFAYGIGTAGGLGDRNLAKKANAKIINNLKQCNRLDYIRGEYLKRGF